MNKFFLIFALAVIAVAGFWFWSKPAPVSETTGAIPQVPAAASAPKDAKTPNRQAAGTVIPPSQASKVLDLSDDPHGEKFVQENARILWQVDPDSLTFEKKVNGERVKLSYIQKFNGLPIFGARVSLFVEGRQVSLVQNSLNSFSQIDGDFALSAAQAEDRLKQQKWTVEASAEPLFFPYMRRLRPAYRIMATRGEKSSDVIVDAVDGRIIRQIPRTHY